MNKYIEAMAKILCVDYGDCVQCICKSTESDGDGCTTKLDCEKLYNAGYRKASDVIDDVNRSLTTKVFNSNEIATGYFWAITDVRKLLLKLKKKYESEGAK